MQHSCKSCSHSNAICIHRFKKRIKLRTQEQPLVAEHRGGTNRVRNDRSRNRRTDEVPFIAGCNHYTEKHKVSCPGFLPKTKPMQHSCNLSNAIWNHSFKKRTELRTQEQPFAIASGTTAAATAAQTRYLSSPAATTLHGKTQGFVLRLPPQNFAHATFMQPFQSDLQPQLQERHRTTHTGTTTRCRTQRRNQSRPERPQPQPPHRRGTFHRRLQPLYTEKHKITQGFVLRLPPQNFAHATFMQIMQPFQCDLHSHIQETHKTTHAGTTTRCRTQRRNQSRPERPQPQPPHRRGTFHRRLQALYTEKHKVSCPGFLPKTKPMQHSCNLSNAICNHSFKKRTEPRTQEQPFAIASGTTAAATAAQTRYLSSPPAATLHGKTQGFVLRLPPQNKAHATFMQPFQCDLQPQLQETHGTTHTGINHLLQNTKEEPKRPQPHPPHLTTSHGPHLPSSPLPFITTSLRHHFPSSPLPIVTTSHRHHLPSSPPPCVTTLCHTFLFYVMYHPSSRSILL